MGNILDRIVESLANLNEVHNLVVLPRAYLTELIGRITSDGYSFNHPVVTAIEDAGKASANRIFRAIGLPDNIGLKGKTVTDVPDSQKEVLRLLISSKKGSKGSIKERDWRKYLGTYTGGNRSFVERVNSPSGLVEHTIGQFTYYTDENGDVHAVDTYDYNVGLRTANNGWYSLIRDLAGVVNSRSNEPDLFKRHYDINLGNRKTWNL